MEASIFNEEHMQLYAHYRLVKLFTAANSYAHLLPAAQNLALSMLSGGIYLQLCTHSVIHGPSHINSPHLSLKCNSHWGTTDDFTTNFLHFPLFSNALWNLVTSWPFYSLKLSSHLFFCLPHLLPPFTVPCKMILARLDER